MSRLKSRGKWFWREEFYSICSAHYEPKEGCILCETGHWYNVWLLKCSRFVWTRWPRLWIIWANRPFLNPTRDFLYKTFPNLKKRKDK